MATHDARFEAARNFPVISRKFEGFSVSVLFTQVAASSTEFTRHFRGINVEEHRFYFHVRTRTRRLHKTRYGAELRCYR